MLAASMAARFAGSQLDPRLLFENPFFDGPVSLNTMLDSIICTPYHINRKHTQIQLYVPLSCCCLLVQCMSQLRAAMHGCLHICNNTLSIAAAAIAGVEIVL